MKRDNVGEKIVSAFLNYIGEDVNREGLIETPKRVVKAWNEWYRAYFEDAPEYKKFRTCYTGIVKRKEIPFQSTCEHHCSSFCGTIDFAYIPDKYATGISKIIRRFQHLSAKLSIQENLTEELIDDFEKEMKPKGSIIVIKALHSCESSRGIRVPNVETITSSVRGVFSKDLSTKNEFFQL